MRPPRTPVIGPDDGVTDDFLPALIPTGVFAQRGTLTVAEAAAEYLVDTHTGPQRTHAGAAQCLGVPTVKSVRDLLKRARRKRRATRIRGDHEGQDGPKGLGRAIHAEAAPRQ